MLSITLVIRVLLFSKFTRAAVYRKRAFNAKARWYGVQIYLNNKYLRIIECAHFEKYHTTYLYRTRLKPIKSDGHNFWATHSLNTIKGFDKNCACFL